MRREKEAAIDRQDFEAAAALRDKEKQLLAARAAREKEWTETAAEPPAAGRGTRPGERRAGQAAGHLARARHRPRRRRCVGARTTGHSAAGP